MAGGTGKVIHSMRGVVGTSSEIAWVTLTGAAGPAPETPGTAMELVASLPADVQFIKVMFENSVLLGNDTSMLCDILTDTGDGDTVRVPDLGVGFTYGAMASGGTRTPRTYGLPLFIPSGAQVLAQLKTKIASDTVRIAIDFYGGFPAAQGEPADSTDTLGKDAPNATGTVLTSGLTAHNWPTTWDVISASTPNAYKALAISLQGDGTLGSLVGVVEVGAGSLASEVALTPEIPFTFDANEGTTLPDPGVYPLENELAAGSRLVARVRNNVGTPNTDARLLVHGIK